MNVTDPIADMLTRIRNAQAAGLDLVEVQNSRMKVEVSRLLKREGFISDYVVDGGKKKTLRVYLKYDARRQPVIRGLTRVSKPGIRRYVDVKKVPKVLGGNGIAVLSTSSGIMTGTEARQKNIGGELLCTVW